MHELTCWIFGGTGNKVTSHFRGEGVEHRHWPTPKPATPPPIHMNGMGYGILRGALDAWKATEAAGYHWMYCDGPPFLLRKGDSVRAAWDTQHFAGQGPDRRVKNLVEKGVQISAWGPHGDTVYVCPSNHLMHQMKYGDDAETWVATTIAKLRKHTDRPIVARWKSDASGDVRARWKDMRKLFQSAWAIVTAGSTIGCEALAAGIPVFTDKACAASPLASRDLSEIESPRCPSDEERDRWAHNLAARQFDTAQLRSGEAWAVMREDLEWISA